MAAWGILSKPSGRVNGRSPRVPIFDRVTPACRRVNDNQHQLMGRSTWVPLVSEDQIDYLFRVIRDRLVTGFSDDEAVTHLSAENIR